MGGILRMRNRHSFSPGFNLFNFLGLHQCCRPIKQLGSKVTLEEGVTKRVRGSPPKKHVPKAWVPLVCLANTFSSFQRAHMARPGGPFPPREGC